MVEHNHPSCSNPPNLILGSVQLSFYTEETRITSGTADPVILQPFISSSSLKVNSSDHMASNAHSKKLENSKLENTSIDCLLFPRICRSSMFSFFQPRTIALPNRKKGGIVGAMVFGPGPLTSRPSIDKGYNWAGPPGQAY